MKHRILISLLFLLVAPIARAQLSTITDLGAISPTGINTWGQVVGNLNGSAVIWSRGQGTRDLGKLSGGSTSYGSSINDLGIVTGTADGLGTVISPDSSIANQQCSDLTQPFVWTPRSGMVGLGTVGVPPYQTMFPYWCEIPFYATTVNDLGQVVGYTAVYTDLYQFAFAGTTSGGIILCCGTSFPPTMANALSDTGQIIGQTGVDIGLATSWAWEGGAAVNLGALDSGSGYSSSANGVNDLGQAVGWSTTIPLEPNCNFNLAECPLHAVMWTREGTITDLGTLPGDTLSAASNINLFGQVIGSSGNTLVGQGWDGKGGSGFDGELGSVAVIGRPFIWSARSGMQDLNTLISPDSGWVLSSVSGINILGQIVGSGSLNGEHHGFLLTP